MTFEYFVETLAERSPGLARTFETVARQNPAVALALGCYLGAETQYLGAELAEFERFDARQAFFVALADANATRYFETVSHVVETVARQEVEFAQRARIASFADAELVLK